MMSLVMITAAPLGMSKDAAVWAITNPTRQESEILVAMVKTNDSSIHSRVRWSVAGITRVSSGRAKLAANQARGRAFARPRNGPKKQPRGVCQGLPLELGP